MICVLDFPVAFPVAVAAAAVHIYSFHYRSPSVPDLVVGNLLGIENAADADVVEDVAEDDGGVAADIGLHLTDHPNHHRRRQHRDASPLILPAGAAAFVLSRLVPSCSSEQDRREVEECMPLVFGTWRS